MCNAQDIFFVEDNFTGVALAAHEMRQRAGLWSPLEKPSLSLSLYSKTETKDDNREIIKRETGRVLDEPTCV